MKVSKVELNSAIQAVTGSKKASPFLRSTLRKAFQTQDIGNVFLDLTIVQRVLSNAVRDIILKSEPAPVKGR